MSVVRVTVSRPVIEVAANAIPVVSGSSVSSVFARTGAVVADAGDYAAFYQPLDADLTAIAALTTTAYGRAFLALADRAGFRSSVGAPVYAVTPVSTTDDTSGTTWCTIPVVSGRSYLVIGAVGATTALASTAANLRFAASGGTTMSAGSITWSAGQSTTFAGGSTVLDAWTPLVSGLGTTERAISVMGSWACTGSGDVLLQVRSEVSGSSVAILGGAILVMEVA